MSDRSRRSPAEAGHRATELGGKVEPQTTSPVGPGPETVHAEDLVRLAIVRKATAFQTVATTERAFSRAAHVLAEGGYLDDDDESRRAVIETFFAYTDAGRDARAADRELDRQLRNLTVVPMPREVLP